MSRLKFQIKAYYDGKNFQQFAWFKCMFLKKYNTLYIQQKLYLRHLLAILS